MKKVITCLFLVVGLTLIIYSGYNIFSTNKDYDDSNEVYDDLNKNYIHVLSDTDEWYNMAEVDFDSLKAINPDVVAWIFFENEDISYPILYSGDDSTYLRKTLEGGSAIAGSIFLEGENNPDFRDCHSIIYGHNMKNLSMFGKLKYYIRVEQYYDSHQFFQIITEDRAYRYQIFGYETITEDSFAYSIGFEHDDSFGGFLQKLKGISMINSDIELTKEDSIVSLSTCSTSGEEYRFVVNAVRVGEHEQ